MPQFLVRLQLPRGLGTHELGAERVRAIDAAWGDFFIWQQKFAAGSGSGSAVPLLEQVRAKRERAVDRVFDEFAKRSKFTRETIVDAGESSDELVADKLRRDRHRMRPWAGIR